jgi:hypothetical protein
VTNIHPDVELREFIVIMHECDNAWTKLPLHEQTRLQALYGAWVTGLREGGAFVTGRPCGGECRLLATDALGEVTDTTLCTEGFSDVVTGIFVIRAVDMDTAVKIAKSCPALLHGETIIVREANHS